MTCSSSCARFNPARAVLGLLVWLLAIRRSVLANRHCRNRAFAARERSVAHPGHIAALLHNACGRLHAAADEPSSAQKHHDFVNADRGSAGLSRFVPSAIFSLKIVFTEGENTMKRDIFLSTVAAAL